MSAALSELSVTEFLTLGRLGFFPKGLVIGSCVFCSGSQYSWQVATGEVNRLSEAIRMPPWLAPPARRRDRAG